MKLAEVVDKVQISVFKPKYGVKIVTDEKATNMHLSTIDDSIVIDNLIRTLESGVKNMSLGFRMSPIQFENDDDTNYHMELIAGFANMRARNYSIPEVDKLKAKFVAGRIIPTIATITAMGIGLVCLELYKVILNHKVEKYRNTSANLVTDIDVNPTDNEPYSQSNLFEDKTDLYTRRKKLQKEIEFLDIQEEYVIEQKNLIKELAMAQEDVKKI